MLSSAAATTASVWRVMIVDDSPDDRAEVRRLLLRGSDRRYRLTEAESGKAAIRAVMEAADGPPDCIVLDYNLPDMDAVEVLAAISGPDGMPVCAVVVVTGNVGNDHTRAVLRAGAQDYLGKEWMTQESMTRAVENASERWAMARELRAKETALRASEERFRGIFDSAFQHIGLLSPDGTVIAINRSALDAVGITSEVAIGQSFWNLPWWTRYPDEQTWVRDGCRRASAGDFVRFEARYRLSDGTEAVVDFSITPVRDERGEVILLVPEGRDISDRKRAEQALADQGRRKDEFLATLAHELRNPLAPICNGLNVLRTILSPDATQKTLGMMDRQLGHLVNLVDDLLDVSRVRTGKIKLRTERVTIREAVDAAVESCRPTIEAKDHILTVDIPEMPQIVNGDKNPVGADHRQPVDKRREIQRAWKPHSGHLGSERPRSHRPRFGHGGRNRPRVVADGLGHVHPGTRHPG
jgi:PAS domain S-box-containing protein